ncbi:MAG: GNAT family N-acetyltransferase [Pseudomonadota bacterium]
MWIREFRAEDAGPCAALFYRAVHDGAAEHYSPEERAAWAPKVPATKAFGERLGGQICFVACNGSVQGFMSLTPLGYLDMAFVAPEQRGRGVAQQLYAALLNRAHVLGLGQLTTHASHLARPFFLRQGWEVEAAETVERGRVDIPRFLMRFSLAE